FITTNSFHPIITARMFNINEDIKLPWTSTERISDISTVAHLLEPEVKEDPHEKIATEMHQQHTVDFHLANRLWDTWLAVAQKRSTRTIILFFLASDVVQTTNHGTDHLHLLNI
ncbi:hypothetical protein ACJX0J_007109, partial [Zea mays]